MLIQVQLNCNQLLTIQLTAEILKLREMFSETV